MKPRNYYVLTCCCFGGWFLVATTAHRPPQSRSLMPRNATQILNDYIRSKATLDQTDHARSNPHDKNQPISSTQDHDDHHDHDHVNHEHDNHNVDVNSDNDNNNDVNESAVQLKKSNAVGDPDDDDDDDDDDNDDNDSNHNHNKEWSDIDTVWSDEHALDTTPLQVQMELLEDDDDDDSNNNNNDHTNIPSSHTHSEYDDDMEEADDDSNMQGSGGGVGVRLKRRNKHIKPLSTLQILQAWQPHVYLPPSIEYLHQHARRLDGASKLRLDRRTLYACLLLEWGNTALARQSLRKFLDPTTRQALQAALSLATQPTWRRVVPRPNAVRLYSDATTFATLAMQETVTMALAHSLGAAVVILDDDVVGSIRQSLLKQGFQEDQVKPSVLLSTLLEAAQAGPLRNHCKGQLSNCMQKDLEQGLDDPFDERATWSCQEMKEWEQAQGNTNTDAAAERALPLVIFLRTQASTSLLKSKSSVEMLLRQSDSEDSMNLVVLGKGVDAQTEVVPEDPAILSEAPESHGMTAEPTSLPGAAPWFGFSPHNQNASGQNDPVGSRRFNIFLARTVDADGTPGILGAIAPPQAGNLFPHMMAMQARERLEQHDDDSPVKAELERWAQLLQQQMQTNGGSPLPPPQFFNASLSPFDNEGVKSPSPDVIQQTLQQAMSDLLDRLAQMNDDSEAPPELSPDVHKAFAQVLRNENLRRGIAENLARAAPALSDPKCQGVMLSVYVPPLPNQNHRGKLSRQQPMGGWFQKILNSQEEAERNDTERDATGRRGNQKRVRTMAAAAAVLAAKNAQSSKESEGKENKAYRNLARLESLCRPIDIKMPTDPVRAKAWESWINRERGAVIFRQNRRALNQELDDHGLQLQEHTGTTGAGSALRQMLSVKDISIDMQEVIQYAIEMEASKSQLQHETPDEMHAQEMGLEVDITLSQLSLQGEQLVETVDKEIVHASNVQYLHPSSLESALTAVCGISPSPAGALSVAAPRTSYRSRDEIMAMAQDKHERALVSQVASPQDIGVTYDMIGGLSEVKELLRQSITYPLKFPHLYSEGIAREAVKGVLLFGPPGTGKTMLAKAVATEGGASFLSVDASSVENKWLGESEKNAKAVFTLARRLAPCVIFIDEVDSLLSSREGTSDDSAHGTLTSVKTTMMSEWDGLNSGTNGAGEAGSDRVIVIGSTNRPFDLDEAVLRRFPRRILVDLPDLETRTEILEVTLAENRIDPSVNLTDIAERLEGFTGSDIKEICREAVVQISHEQARLLDQGITGGREDLTQGSLQRLRPVTKDDFEAALGKLKRSVSEKGRELARVWEWNEEYGEIKKEKTNKLPHLASMYL